MSASNGLYVEEKTEVLYDQNEIVSRVIERCYNVKYAVDACTDINGPSMLVNHDHPLTKPYSDMAKRGVRIRFITEITRDNLPYCRELMKIAGVRHLDETKGNLGIVDGDTYYASATSTESGPPPQLIISTVKAIVQQQQYFFDMLWHMAIPAKQRIKEIEEDAKRQFIDTVQDGVEINDLVYKLVKSAKEEILILFPTTNTFYRYDREGLVKLIRDAATHSGMKIRIFVYVDDENIRESICQDYPVGDRIRMLMLQKSELQSKVMSVIIDNEYSLAIEIEDDRALDSTDASGFATYSNSDSTVTIYISIFETLWLQAELRNKQKEIPRIS